MTPQQKQNIECILDLTLNASRSKYPEPIFAELWALLGETFRDYAQYALLAVWTANNCVEPEIDWRTCGCTHLRSLLAKEVSPSNRLITPHTQINSIVSHSELGFGRVLSNITAENGVRVIQVRFDDVANVQWLRSDTEFVSVYELFEPEPVQAGISSTENV